MQIEEYIVSKPDAELTYPFGEDVAVYKVKNKMFALVSHHQQRPSVNLKTDPADAIELRDIFSDVIPGYHMNKQHWNTVFLDGDVPVGEIERQVDCSYALVVKGLTKRQREALELSYGPEALYKGLRK